MKRYLLFAGDQYYPVGGMHDLVGDFDSVEDAKLALRGDWAHVYDTDASLVIDVWQRRNDRWAAPIDFTPFRPGDNQ